ncbi:hypothetical protein [Actinokineospora sp. NPDC004072]
MSNRQQALTAIYQSDRADRSTAFTVSLATMGAAVTYLVGTIAFYDKLDTLGWVIALLPFPMICIAAFHAVLINLAAVRATSILALEQALLLATAPNTGPDLDPTRIGVTASEHATNIHTARPAQRAALIIAYGGVGLIYLAFIALMLTKAAHHLHAWTIIPAAVYVALLVPIALAWRDGTANLKPTTS